MKCSICLKFIKEEDIHCLPCNSVHSFCTNCLKEKVKSQIYTTTSLDFFCPVCKTKITWPEGGLDDLKPENLYQVMKREFFSKLITEKNKLEEDHKENLDLLEQKVNEYKDDIKNKIDHFRKDRTMVLRKKTNQYSKLLQQVEKFKENPQTLDKKEQLRMEKNIRLLSDVSNCIIRRKELINSINQWKVLFFENSIPQSERFYDIKYFSHTFFIGDLFYIFAKRHFHEYQENFEKLRKLFMDKDNREIVDIVSVDKIIYILSRKISSPSTYSVSSIDKKSNYQMCSVFMAKYATNRFSWIVFTEKNHLYLYNPSRRFLTEKKDFFESTPIDKKFDGNRLYYSMNKDDICFCEIIDLCLSSKAPENKKLLIINVQNNFSFKKDIIKEIKTGKEYFLTDNYLFLIDKDKREAKSISQGFMFEKEENVEKKNILKDLNILQNSYTILLKSDENNRICLRTYML